MAKEAKGKRRLVLVSTMTYDPADHQGEISTQPSLTVPDMAMSVQQILERFSQGQQVKTFNPFYYDEEIPEFEQMDLAELQDYKLGLHDEIQRLNQEIQNKMDKPAEPVQAAIIPPLPAVEEQQQ